MAIADTVEKYKKVLSSTLKNVLGHIYKIITIIAMQIKIFYLILQFS